jgi:DNA-binding protein HU-beta
MTPQPRSAFPASNSIGQSRLRVARAIRTGFNPHAKTKIEIAASKVPKFVTGTAFKVVVDPAFASASVKRAQLCPGLKFGTAAMG